MTEDGLTIIDDSVSFNVIVQDPPNADCFEDTIEVTIDPSMYLYSLTATEPLLIEPVLTQTNPGCPLSVSLTQINYDKGFFDSNVISLDSSKPEISFST
jgi:hypothetical protein